MFITRTCYHDDIIFLGFIRIVGRINWAGRGKTLFRSSDTNLVLAHEMARELLFRSMIKEEMWLSYQCNEKGRWSVFAYAESRFSDDAASTYPGSVQRRRPKDFFKSNYSDMIKFPFKRNACHVYEAKCHKVSLCDFWSLCSNWFESKTPQWKAGHVGVYFIYFA